MTYLRRRMLGGIRHIGCGTVWFVGLILIQTADQSPAISAEAKQKPISDVFRIVVMDPLAKQLACDCVAGYAQRDYGRLADVLGKRLEREVEVAYTESLARALAEHSTGVDLVVGKYSVVVSDGKLTELPLRPLAMLSGQDGSITQTGLFVVRQKDPARSIEDLAGYRFLFGPPECDEKRSAAFAALEAFDIPIPQSIEFKDSCGSAALAVVESDADAAVLSSYAMPLLQGCGTIEKDELRIVGQTDPVPFITVFATNRISTELETSLRDVFQSVKKDGALLTALQSKSGFVPLPSDSSTNETGRKREWCDYRGPNRDGISAAVPTRLETKPVLLWSHVLTGPGMGGLSVAAGHIIVVDKSLDETADVFRCLDADTGRELWRLSYPAPGPMDFTNSPRATPVIDDGLVYLLGAMGDLHCVRLESGAVVWKRQLTTDFGTKRPMWGYASTPLIVDDKLIVNPGATDAALVALDRRTGDVVWKTPGNPAAYSSFILGVFGGIRQIVGYDVTSLGGWDPETGKRLWQLVPDVEGDFNVPTAISVGGRLLVATENNGTRLYAFDSNGQIRTAPVAVNEDLSPDMSTPLVLDGRVFGSSNGVHCLELAAGMKTVWSTDEEALADYGTFIGGHHHVLLMTQAGELCLFPSNVSTFQPTARYGLFDDVASEDREVWSHPALVGNRLYVRNLLGVYCFILE